MNKKQTLTKLLMRSELLISIIITISSVLFTAWLLPSLIDSNDERKSEPSMRTYESEYFKAIDKVVELGDSSTLNIETFRKVFNAIDRKSGGLLFNYGFTNVLEDYSVRIIQDSLIKSVNNLKIVLGVIDEELEEEPFNQLPPEQRRILINLRNTIDDNDKSAANYNLNELNNILRIRNENFLVLEKQNSWSIPLAIAGLLLTVIFGIFGIIKSLKTAGN